MRFQTFLVLTILLLNGFQSYPLHAQSNIDDPEPIVLDLPEGVSSIDIGTFSCQGENPSDLFLYALPPSEKDTNGDWLYLPFILPENYERSYVYNCTFKYTLAGTQEEPKDFKFWVDARGAQAAEPGPVEPGPVEPGPVEPGPVEPGPVEPGPVEPGPVEPGPVEPGPVEPGAWEPGKELPPLECDKARDTRNCLGQAEVGDGTWFSLNQELSGQGPEVLFVPNHLPGYKMVIQTLSTVQTSWGCGPPEAPITPGKFDCSYWLQRSLDPTIIYVKRLSRDRDGVPASSIQLDPGTVGGGGLNRYLLALNSVPQWPNKEANMCWVNGRPEAASKGTLRVKDCLEDLGIDEWTRTERSLYLLLQASSTSCVDNRCVVLINAW